jgi:hypothetical protein
MGALQVESLKCGVCSDFQNKSHPLGPLTSGLTTGALACGEASVSHLSLEEEECKITIFKEPQKIGTRKK